MVDPIPPVTVLDNPSERPVGLTKLTKTFLEASPAFVARTEQQNLLVSEVQIIQQLLPLALKKQATLASTAAAAVNATLRDPNGAPAQYRRSLQRMMKEFDATEGLRSSQLPPWPASLNNIRSVLEHVTDFKYFVEDLVEAPEPSTTEGDDNPSSIDNGHQNKESAIYRINCANALVSEYTNSISLANLNTAIYFLQEAVAELPDTSPSKSGVLCYLYKALLSRFCHRRWIHDMSEARISVNRVLMLMLGAGASHGSPLMEQSDAAPIGLQLLHGLYVGISFDELGVSIALFEEVLESKRMTANERYLAQSGLSHSLLLYGLAINDPELLKRSIEEIQKILDAMQLGDPRRPPLLLSLEVAYGLQFCLTRNMDDLKLVEQTGKRAYREEEEAHSSSQRGIEAVKLAQQDVGSVDLNKGIDDLRNSLRLRPCGHPYRSVSLANLATGLAVRFGKTGQQADLDESIALHCEALDLQPDPHPQRRTSLDHLARILFTRFEHNDHLPDLDKSITYRQEALLLSSNYKEQATTMERLAHALSERFRLNGEISDLEESIALLRKSLDLHPPDSNDRIINLADALGSRFEQKRELSDIEESISLLRGLFESCAVSDSHIGALDSLATALCRRFSRNRDQQHGDLHEAIKLYQRTADLVPDSDPHRLPLLNNLANALCRRFQLIGQSSDLDEAIALYRKALDLLPNSHSRRVLLLNNLATALNSRFGSTGRLSDLKESVALYRQAIEIIPQCNPTRPIALNNLGDALCVWFNHGRDIAAVDEAIDKAIDLYQQALEVASETSRVGSLTGLGDALFRRYQQNMQIEDLEKSIDTLRKAYTLQSNSLTVNNLASVLAKRFDIKGNLEDIDEAISMHQKVLDILSDHHPNRTGSRNNLANALIQRYEANGVGSDLDDAMTLFEQASSHGTARMVDRATVARAWAQAATRFRHPSGISAFTSAMSLLRQLSSLDLTIRQRRQILSRSRGLAVDAAWYALNQKLPLPETAIEFLDTGRAVFWSQGLHLRTSIEQLAVDHPKLARDFREVSAALEKASFSENTLQMSESIKSFDEEQEAQRASALARKREDLLASIHQLDGFRDFLRPKSFSQLATASARGTVIILNASTHGCDALVLKEKGPPLHVPLGIKFGQVQALMIDLLAARGQISSDSRLAEVRDTVKSLLDDRGLCSATELPSVLEDVLRILWTYVALPIFEKLKLEPSEDLNALPRVWWYTTGAFSFLPIHAAGIYRTGEVDCVSDYCISSYAPTLEVLLSPPNPQPLNPTFMALIQPEIQGKPELALPATKLELEKIESHVPSLLKLGTKDSPSSVSRVLSRLPEVSFAHFACHGMQNLFDPLESSLLLSNGKLKISEIMKNPLPHASLAFLSACETAQGAVNDPDEALHIAATMLFTGFRSVVGTMWSIKDGDAPIVADVFYEHLHSDGAPDGLKSAEALHQAIQALRGQKASLERWVPFIHLGL